MFSKQRLVDFCDGDFWHGRNFKSRRAKLKRGHNADYWIQKISGNIARDRRNNRSLREGGWLVVRYWERDIVRNPENIAGQIVSRLALRASLR